MGKTKDDRPARLARDVGTANDSIFIIESIVAQKDNYGEMRAGDFGDRRFEESDASEARVAHFKRFKIRGKARGRGKEIGFTILLSLRGNYVQVMSDDRDLLSVRILFLALANLLSESSFRKVSYRTDSRGREVETTHLPVRLIAGTTDDAKAALGVVENAWALADLLHHVRDLGGFTRSGNLIELP